MTDAQEEALAVLRQNAPNPVVLHVAVGGALVKLGKAKKESSGGHGKLQAAYRAA